MSELRQKVREEILRSAAILRPDELAVSVDAVFDHAAPSNPAEVGDFVLVPREPVPEMLAAWYRYKNGRHWPDEPLPADTSDYGAYRAMIAAAPSPPIEEPAAWCDPIIEWDESEIVGQPSPPIGDTGVVAHEYSDAEEWASANGQDVEFVRRLERGEHLNDQFLAIAALVPARVEAVEPRVKPLEWEAYGGRWRAASPGIPVLKYIINPDKDRRFYVSVNGQPLVGKYPTSDGAKAAAQSHFDAAILSALQANPS